MSLQSHGVRRSLTVHRSLTPRLIRPAAVALTGLIAVGAGIGIASSASAAPESAAVEQVRDTKALDLSHIAAVALAAGVSPQTVHTLTADPDATYAAAVNHGIPPQTVDWVLANPEAALGAAHAAGIDVVWAANTLAAAL